MWKQAQIDREGSVQPTVARVRRTLEVCVANTIKVGLGKPFSRYDVIQVQFSVFI